MDTTLDEVLALLGTKEVQIYSLSKRIDELEAEKRDLKGSPLDQPEPPEDSSLHSS